MHIGRASFIAALAVSASMGAAGLGYALDYSRPEPGEALPGGAATSHADLNSSAFSHSSDNMSFERELDFKVGDGIFRKLWVAAPSSTTSSDGLGPLFNSRSCQGCHLKDGRGRPPEKGEEAVALFLRLSVPPTTEQEREALRSFRQATIPEPTYGGQLQNFAIQGLLAEGQMVITYKDRPIRLADGATVTLRAPTYSVDGLNYGPMRSDVMLSPRIAPPMIGLGLLELIPEEAILANADPDDRNGDGIRGRPNTGWDVTADKPMLGRFGWKAGEPTIRQQVAHAFAGDIGLSTAIAPLSWGDCTVNQKQCLDAPDGADPVEKVEVTARMMDLVTFYSRNLAVPARRNPGSKQVLAGKKLFHDIGCAACHVPSFRTASADDRPELSDQLIWPYTDLLLHDMGEDLADNRPEAAAGGRDWRTPPLWGVGLTRIVNGHTNFLHDGRARNVLEAILWHGGEAQGARDRVIKLSRRDREALLAFVNSL